MTDDQFKTFRFSHSEVMVFHKSHPEAEIEMMLIGINFEHGMFQLVPLDIERYEDESYWIPYKYADKSRKKLKMKIVYGNQPIKIRK